MNLLRIMYMVTARLLDNPRQVYSQREEVLKIAQELGLGALAGFFQEMGEEEVEGHRVELFELAPRCPPYAGYYALGEDSRERGLYMHQVLTYYKAFGFTMDVRQELPDYLPVMLEFLASTTDVEDFGRREMRRDFYRRFIKPWFPKFKECVEKSNSPYRYVLHALEKLFKLDFEEE